MTTKKLLWDFKDVMNKHGAFSVEAEAFIQNNLRDQEFVELAKLAQKVKRALCPPPRSQ